MFENLNHMQRWCRLGKRKFSLDAGGDGDCYVSAEELGGILGNSMTVTDVAGSVFASGMIRAYPKARVISTNEVI